MKDLQIRTEPPSVTLDLSRVSPVQRERLRESLAPSAEIGGRWWQRLLGAFARKTAWWLARFVRFFRRGASHGQ
jgi:hypothetical protein